jgi:TorA maturation chaperone TorD
MEAAAPVILNRALPPEEAARGDFYALLGRLFHGAPDALLLGRLAAADSLPAEGTPGLARAWQDLVDASSVTVMDPDAAIDEYEQLFVGMGKAAVSIYAGHYAGAPSIAHPRIRLQAELAALGLARKETVVEPEDHIAGLFEVMRVLVAGGAGRQPAPVAEQKRFFQAYLSPAVHKFVSTVGAAPEANYYRAVAGFAAAFLALEAESFQLDD